MHALLLLGLHIIYMPVSKPRNSQHTATCPFRRMTWHIFLHSELPVFLCLTFQACLSQTMLSTEAPSPLTRLLWKGEWVKFAIHCQCTTHGLIALQTLAKTHICVCVCVDIYAYIHTHIYKSFQWFSYLAKSYVQTVFLLNFNK